MSNKYDWLKRNLEKLATFTPQLSQVSNIHYNAHAWTPLKLIALAHWVDVYTKIISKHKEYGEDFWYIDLLAGPGTNFIKEANTVIAGSPFIAYFCARTPFTKYIFIEYDSERVKALEERINLIEDLRMRATTYRGDCNKIISALNITAKHFLAFIDCEGLDVSWKTCKKLLTKRGDIIIVFQTQSLRRTLGRAKRNLSDKERMNEFLGDTSWRNANNADELLKLYMRKLKKYRNYVGYVRIRGRYMYDIILACKKGPYIHAWESLRKRYLKITDKDAELALRILKGEVTTIDKFFTSYTTLNKWI